MPKQIDYPRASLKNSLELANAVYEFGGGCSTEIAADKLNKKVTGAFSALIASSVKYGLINIKKGQLSTTDAFRDYKLAYTPDEANKKARMAFLSIPLFKEIHNRFLGKKLPVEHFENLLIRECDVPQQLASRVAGYFIEGGKQTGLIDSEYKLIGDEETETSDEQENNDTNDRSDTESDNINDVTSTQLLPDGKGEKESFSVRIKGPGIDSIIAVNEEEDLLIVQAMLKKVEKQLT